MSRAFVCSYADVIVCVLNISWRESSIHDGVVKHTQ